MLRDLWLGDADHAASLPATRVTHRLRPIIDLLVDNHATAKDGIFATELEHAVFQLQMRFAGAVRLEVPHVARMAFGRIRSTVRLFHRIEMATGRRSIWSRAIAELMDVESMFARRKSSDVGDYLNGIAHLGKRDRSHDLTAGGRMENGDGLFGLLRGSEGSKRANRDNGKDRHGEMIAE